MNVERVMTCAEAAGLLDAFVDAELPAATLLAVARHAGGCGECDAAVRELTALREAVERSVAGEAAAVDLARVWPAVSRDIARHAARVEWRRRLRTVPAWGVALAVAASTVLWLRSPAPDARLAARPPRRNQAVIERIDSSAPFELRRERKYGTTLIMVSADGDPADQ
ncbi:MAG TPA: zf-HC2 domain-containing protein [Candidatus Limnocylindria bacterium]|nr:zf-HC2 domain-containing protein [Candidatus Limnocylindria bacterium]